MYQLMSKHPMVPVVAVILCFVLGGAWIQACEETAARCVGCCNTHTHRLVSCGCRCGAVCWLLQHAHTGWSRVGVAAARCVVFILIAALWLAINIT